jgi:hypothetical protein
LLMVFMVFPPAPRWCGRDHRSEAFSAAGACVIHRI